MVINAKNVSTWTKMAQQIPVSKFIYRRECLCGSAVALYNELSKDIIRHISNRD